MSNFFTIPLLLDVDIREESVLEDISAYSELDFGEPRYGESKNVIVMKQLPTPQTGKKNIKRSIHLIQTSPALCETKVLFSKELAKKMSTFLKEPVEVGGQLQIERYVNTGNASIGVLVFDESELIRGDTETFSVLIPPEKFSPFSFHTHPDVCYKTLGCFLGWPSGADISLMVLHYLQNNDVLAHFVISSEGIWVIHLKPQFQRVLYSLKTNNMTAQCQEQLVAFIRESFTLLHGQRQYEFVTPLDRYKSRENFLLLSETLKISDYRGTDVEQACADFIRDDAAMFDIDLIKWKTFDTTTVILTFTYMFDPFGGFPVHIASNEEMQRNDVEMKEGFRKIEIGKIRKTRRYKQDATKRM